MSVFVSWSSPANRNIGRAVREFVSEVLGTDSVFMSDEDIEPGEKSLEEIDAALKRSTAALVIVSARSARDPWLNFEAGAMGVRLEKARVIPILLDLDFSQLIQPLAQFQGIRFDNRDKFNQMLRVLNNQRGDNRIKPETLNIVFDAKWESFVHGIRLEIDANAKPDDAEALPDESDKIDEILSTIRRMSSGSSQSAARKNAVGAWAARDASAPSQSTNATVVFDLIADVVPLKGFTMSTGPDGRGIEAKSRTNDLSYGQRMSLASISAKFKTDITLIAKDSTYIFRGSDGTWESVASVAD